MPPSRLKIAAAYFMIYVVWGSTYYFIGVCLRDIPPFALGALRFSAAGAALLLICRLQGEKLFRRRLIMKSAVSGIVLLFVDQAVIMFAQRFVSSSLVAIVASSTAVWIMLLDVPMWKRTFKSAATVAGMLAGFVGVALLYAEQLYSDAHTIRHGEYGILLLTGGCISWACGTLYSKYRCSAEEETDGLAGAAWQMAAASAAFAVCALVCGDFGDVTPTAVSASAWASLAYLVTFGSMLAYTAYIWLLKVRPATEVATHAYVNPVVAVAIGAGLGGEQVTPVQLAGLAVILLSVMLVNKRKPETQTTEK